MDELRLEVGERDDPANGVVDAVEVFVNGRDLREVVREVELPFARREGRPALAGDYAGLPPEDVFLPSRRLLGEPTESYEFDEPRGKLVVLGCTCGDVGCWPLLVEIAVREDTVIWSDFEQPRRRRWRHDELGPFVFDRAQSMDELQRKFPR